MGLLLVRDPEQRLTARHALSHWWLRPRMSEQGHLKNIAAMNNNSTIELDTERDDKDDDIKTNETSQMSSDDDGNFPESEELISDDDTERTEKIKNASSAVFVHSPSRRSLSIQ